MMKKVELINKNECFFQIQINDVSPMTLFIDVKKDAFCGSGTIYFDLLSLKKAKKDFKDFFEKKAESIYLKDTGSIDYYLHIQRNNHRLEIKGKIGDYTNQTLEFYLEFQEELCDYNKILNIKMISMMK